MQTWYVDIDGIDDGRLAFLGYRCVGDNNEFKIYRHDLSGDEQIVEKAQPRLHVHDINDAMEIGASGVAIPVPDRD